MVNQLKYEYTWKFLSNKMKPEENFLKNNTEKANILDIEEIDMIYTLEEKQNFSREGMKYVITTTGKPYEVVELNVRDRVLNRFIVEWNFQSAPHILNNKSHMENIYVSGKAWFVPSSGQFPRDFCPHLRCQLFGSHSGSSVVVSQFFPSMSWNKPPTQIWAWVNLECPLIARRIDIAVARQLDIATTYRPDSNITYPFAMYIPFEYLQHFRYRKPELYELRVRLEEIANRTGAAVALVSNCASPFKRMEFIKELQKYMQVDVWGGERVGKRCATFWCPPQGDCLHHLAKRYKFYLAFETRGVRTISLRSFL